MCWKKIQGTSNQNQEVTSVSPLLQTQHVLPTQVTNQVKLEDEEGKVEKEIEVRYNLKRKCFIDANENIPKFTRTDSENSSLPISQPAPDSQRSNYSDSSDLVFDKRQENFNKLMMCLKEIDPTQNLNIFQPLDVTVQSRTLNTYAVTVGKIWKLVLETVTQSVDRESFFATSNFFKMVIETLGIAPQNPQQKVSLALHILESIQEYYSIACSGSSRGAIATRKQVLLSVTGKSVRSSNQLASIAKAIGARKSTVALEAKKRILLEEQRNLIPYLDILSRKSPEGARIVTDYEKFEVISFYESENVSDVLKGHNNVLRETVFSESGEKCLLNRQKRVLKVHLVDILPLAQKEIGFKYSLRTLTNLRPKWVLLAREAHVLTCLCDRCVNVQLILRCISNFARKIRTHGAPSDKTALASFDISTSTSEFISKVLHPKLDSQMWHRPECYAQTCQSSGDFPCGTEKLRLHFQPLLTKFGETEVELHQHVTVQYTKADGSRGTKLTQVLTTQTIRSIVELLDQRMFGKVHQQPYVQHRLKMLLGSKMRKDIHQNLGVTDAACWTDYSKELDVAEQEQCKSGAFGASNVTIQLVGQVFELRVLPPSSPNWLCFDQEKKSITFSKPELDGGSNIQSYEIHLKLVAEDTWFLFKTVKVKNLSQDPDIPPDLFGRLSGVFQLRVYARNLCGLGGFSDILVEVDGDLPFRPQEYSEVLEDSFSLKYCTFYAEYFFFSDHNDAPKVNNEAVLKI